MIFRKWGERGCLKLFQKFFHVSNFSKNSSVLETTPIPYHQTNKYLKLLQSSPSPLTLWGLERIELNLLQIFLTSSRYSHKTSACLTWHLVQNCFLLGDISLLLQKIATFTSVWYIFSFLLEQNITGWYFQCLGASEKTQGAHCRNKHWGMFEQKISAWQQDVMNLVGMFPKLSFQLPRNI